MTIDIYSPYLDFVFAGVITPLRLHGTTEGYLEVSGCVYKGDGVILPQAQIPVRFFRQGKSIATDPVILQDHPVSPPVMGTAVYLGIFVPHFGHFLLETLSRFFIFSQMGSFDWYVFHVTPEFKKRHLDLPFIKDVFSVFGIDSEKIIFIKEATGFDKLIVPYNLFVINKMMHPMQRWVYDFIRVASRRKDIGVIHDKIYLSRKHIKYRGVENEAEIEDVFAARGYKVLYFEGMPFLDQVWYVSHARVVGGFSGSALHHSVFMQSGASIVNMGTPHPPSYSADRVFPNQELCDSLNSIRNHFIPFRGEGAVFDISWLSEQLENAEKEIDEHYLMTGKSESARIP